MELLLMRPIRRSNLIALRLGVHVLRAGERIVIVIDESEVKNRVGHEYTIPPGSARLLDFYIRHLLPLFGDNPAGFLFPGDVPGRAKTGEQFGRFFTKTIRQQSGLEVYPHLLRHIAAPFTSPSTRTASRWCAACLATAVPTPRSAATPAFTMKSR